jgi:hypothetical protein
VPHLYLGKKVREREEMMKRGDSQKKGGYGACKLVKRIPSKEISKRKKPLICTNELPNFFPSVRTFGCIS